VQKGEAFVREVYQHVVRSPQWPRLAMVWTYDEGGGFADHVPPPNQACVASPSEAAFFELGQRVPFVVISPWSKPHSVSHVVQEHTAITRFIETIFGLPALTARDANSPALLDLFDFSCPAPLLTPPEPPEAGIDGCK
jgi:phospholipase C